MSDGKNEKQIPIASHRSGDRTGFTASQERGRLTPLVTQEQAALLRARFGIGEQCAMKVDGGARCSNRGIPEPPLKFYVCPSCLRALESRLAESDAIAVAGGGR
jgi:hypothetical protein